MIECAILLHENRLPTPVAAAGMTLTGLRRLIPAFPSFSFDDEQALDVKSSRKRRLGKEIHDIWEHKPYHYGQTKALVVSLSDYSSESDDGRRKGISREGTCLSHGSMSVIGRRREMEDSVAIQLGFMSYGSKDYDFFGVYDGHGGSRVANSCRGRLHHLLVKEIPDSEAEECRTESCLGKEDWSKIMMECFLKMDDEVNRTVTISAKSDPVASTTGSTAVVAVVGVDEVVIANCGDSRAVLSRGGVPVSISNDHMPDRFDEMDRIERAGGSVYEWNGPRVLGVLTISRSIGDGRLEPIVIAEPEVIINKRSNADEFLILASDGLWDVVSNEVACQVVKSCLDGRVKWRCGCLYDETKKWGGEIDGGGGRRRAEMAAGFLVQLAMSRGSRDNISVVVVDLNKTRHPDLTHHH